MKLKPLPYWFPLGVKFKFKEHSRPFKWGCFKTGFRKPKGSTISRMLRYTSHDILHVCGIRAACVVFRSSRSCGCVHFTLFGRARKIVDAVTRTLSGAVHVTLAHTVGLNFLVLVIQEAKSPLFVGFFTILVIFTSNTQEYNSRWEKTNSQSGFHVEIWNNDDWENLVSVL